MDNLIALSAHVIEFFHLLDVKQVEHTLWAYSEKMSG